MEDISPSWHAAANAQPDAPELRTAVQHEVRQIQVACWVSIQCHVKQGDRSAHGLRHWHMYLRNAGAQLYSTPYEVPAPCRGWPRSHSQCDKKFAFMQRLLLSCLV